MPKRKLTVAFVKGAEHSGKGTQTLFYDTEVPGLALRVTKAGAKAYCIEYRHGGRSRRVTLEKAGRITSDQARKLARLEFGRLAEGKDPAERKRREREGDTLGDVAGRYLDDLRARAKAGAAKGRLSGYQSAKQLWTKHVPPALKRRRVVDVTAEDVRRIHKGLAEKPATADHVRTVIHAVLERALTEGLIQANPAAAIKRYNKPPKRRRALSLEELARLGEVLNKVEVSASLEGRAMDPAAALALRLLAMTGMRKSELLGHQSKGRRGPREGLRWADLDLDEGWYELTSEGGGSGAKGGQERRLPLGKAVVDLLRAVKPEGVDPETPVVESATNRGKPYRGLNHARARIYEAAWIEGCDTHSLRHSFESVAFSIAPGLAGALTGRAVTRDPVLNQYIHLDDDALRDVADKVAGRIAQAMAGELADVVAIESRRG